jgi:hypothetical protein
MVNLFAHLDVDHPSIADYDGQSTEPVFLQAREGAEEQRSFSVADARRQPVTEFGLSNGHPGC